MAANDCFVSCDFKFKRLVNGAVRNLTNEWAALRVRIGNSSFYFSPNLRTDRATEIQANSISSHVLRDKKTDFETYL